MQDTSDFVVRPLQLNDLPFAIALEQSSFPPNEAATPEKVVLDREGLIVDRIPHSNMSSADLGNL